MGLLEEAERSNERYYTSRCNDRFPTHKLQVNRKVSEMLSSSRNLSSTSARKACYESDTMLMFLVSPGSPYASGFGVLGRRHSQNYRFLRLAVIALFVTAMTS